ncbi:MAG: DUF2889 domain-containing protein [Mycobacterium sp.]
MPFVSDIAGPQRPVHNWPQPVRGAMRRTSTIDTHPAGPSGADVDLRARDVVVGGSGAVSVVNDVVVRAHLSERAIDQIEGVADERLDRLKGSRVGPGFRAVVGEVLGRDVERSTPLALLLDDWAGASLVSGYATQHSAITSGTEQKLPDGVADRMGGICAGFALDASLIGYARDQNIIPCVHGPLAPQLTNDADAMHPVEPLRAHGMRRMRRLDLNPHDGTSAAFDSHFRDTHVDEFGVETIVHEYSVVGRVDVTTRTLSDVTATVRVLPWQECPGAIGSAGRVNGMTVGELRNRIRTEFVGTSTCTHLNDTLRALGDLGALLDERAQLV